MGITIMGISRDKADATFSQYIRLRDGKCVRCHSPVRLNAKGLPISHHCSHYHGRRKESVRFDPENCDCLCHGCHVHWGSTDREGYRAFKIKQLGRKRFDALQIRANTYKKKDRNMSYIKAKALLDTVWRK